MTGLELWVLCPWSLSAGRLLAGGLEGATGVGRKGGSGGNLAGGGEYRDADGSVINLHCMGWPSSLRLWYLLCANKASSFRKYTTSAVPLPSILQLLNSPTTPKSSWTSCWVTNGCKFDTVILELDGTSCLVDIGPFSVWDLLLFRPWSSLPSSTLSLKASPVSSSVFFGWGSFSPAIWLYNAWPLFSFSLLLAFLSRSLFLASFCLSRFFASFSLSFLFAASFLAVMVRYPAIMFASRSKSSLLLSTFAVIRIEFPIIVADRSGGTSCLVVIWIWPPVESDSDLFCWCKFCLCSFLRSSSKEMERTRGLPWFFLEEIFPLASTKLLDFDLAVNARLNWALFTCFWASVDRRSCDLLAFLEPPTLNPTFRPLCKTLPLRIFFLNILNFFTSQIVKLLNTSELAQL